MSIKTGDPIPNVRLFELDNQGAPRTVSAAERFAGKRIVLFAVPGAFTRTCSQVHLPSFVQNADAIKAKGIDEIVCVAVNDAMVLAAWGREHGLAGRNGPRKSLSSTSRGGYVITAPSTTTMIIQGP
jgi:peroxiredoxin